MKTILMIGTYIPSAKGNQNSWHDLSQRLIVANYNVAIVSSHSNKFFRWFDMTWTILKLRKYVNIAQLDVFSGNAFLWAFTSGVLLALLKIPIIIILRGGNLPKFSKNFAWLVSWLLSLAAEVLAPSGYLYEQMKPYRADIKLIPNAIDINRYLYRQRQQANFKLVWLRAFHEIYNPSLAVRMAEVLKREGVEFGLRMVGPDKGDGSYQRVLALVEKKGLGGSFIFPGGVKKEMVPEELNLGDIFLNTTNVDNTPISVMEAMACGLCIVSTNVGGIPYLLEDGVDALLVPPDDPQAMADAVRRINSEPGLAGKLSANARRKAESFDWSEVLPQWEVLLERYPK